MKYDEKKACSSPPSCTMVITTDGTPEGNASLVVTMDPPPPDESEREARGPMSHGIAVKMLEIFNVYCLGKYGRPVFKTVEIPQMNIKWSTEEIMGRTVQDMMSMVGAKIADTMKDAGVGDDQNELDEEHGNVSPRNKLH